MGFASRTRVKTTPHTTTPSRDRPSRDAARGALRRVARARAGANEDDRPRRDDVRGVRARVRAFGEKMSGCGRNGRRDGIDRDDGSNAARAAIRVDEDAGDWTHMPGVLPEGVSGAEGGDAAGGESVRAVRGDGDERKVVRLARRRWTGGEGG